jgi:hypothetical protein
MEGIGVTMASRWVMSRSGALVPGAPWQQGLPVLRVALCVVRSVLAEYRPIGLVALGASTIHAGRASTYADRRRAAAERLSLAADLSVRLEAVAGAPAQARTAQARTAQASAGASSPEPAGTAIDPDGVLQAAIRALLPLAHRSQRLDLAVSLGPDHRWAARLTRGDNGLQVDLVPWSPTGPGVAGPAVASPTVASPTVAGRTGSAPGVSDPSEARIAHELADLVWSGEVGAR